MANRNEIESLMFYVLGENNRQLLIKAGLCGVTKEARVTALRGLQDLGWIGHGGMADFEESYSLTKEGRRISANHPEVASFDKNLQEHMGALRDLDGCQNGALREALRRLITIQCEIANWDSALVNCFELRKAAEKAKDVGSEAFALFYIGRIEVAQNRWDEALEVYLGAIEKYMEAGDRKGVCTVNRSMGIVYGNKGDHASALRCFESSLQMARTIGDKNAEALAQGNLAIVFDLEGRTAESENALKHCLEYFLEINDRVQVARTSNNLGVLNMSRDNYAVAAGYLESTIESSRVTKNTELLGTALVNAGYCYAKGGDTNRAITYTDEAVRIFKEPSNHNMLALSYRNYGAIEMRNSNIDKGFEWLEKSVRLAKSSGVEDTFAACCFEYGMALIHSSANLKLATKLLKRASSLYRGIGNVAQAKRVETQIVAA